MINPSFETSFKAFSISWINIGVNLLMILYVESFQGKTPPISSLEV